jgi:hypothetical protein
MTNHNLSLAAQAVLAKAVNIAHPHLAGMGSTQEQFSRVVAPIVAAALRAAVDQVVPAEDEDVYLVPWNFTEHMRQRQDSRRKFLAIAAELAGTPTTPNES